MNQYGNNLQNHVFIVTVSGDMSILSRGAISGYYFLKAIEQITTSYADLFHRVV